METVALPIKARKHWMDAHTQKKKEKKKEKKKKKNKEKSKEKKSSNIVKGDWQLTLGIVLSFLRVCVFCCCFVFCGYRTHCMTLVGAADECVRTM